MIIPLVHNSVEMIENGIAVKVKLMGSSTDVVIVQQVGSQGLKEGGLMFFIGGLEIAQGLNKTQLVIITKVARQDYRSGILKQTKWWRLLATCTASRAWS